MLNLRFNAYAQKCTEAILSPLIGSVWTRNFLSVSRDGELLFRIQCVKVADTNLSGTVWTGP